LVFAGALVASVLVGAVPASASSSVVVRTIRVGTAPDAVSSDGTHVWVADERGQVTELSASTGAVIRTISAGDHPVGVSSDGTHVWVADNTGNNVTELSASTGAFIREIAIGKFPGNISSDGTHVWVTNAGNTVSELSASTGAVIQTIPMGNGAFGVSSDGTHVWVTNANSVSELSASTGAVIQTIGVGIDPGAISSDGTHVWVTHFSEDTVTEILAGVPQGNIFATTFKHCTTLHVGYNRFVDGTIVHWRVMTNGVGTVASGQFTAIGGGKLGSKTYHFLDTALGTTLPSDASGVQSHVLFTWANGGRFYATRDPGC
jgi:hypothetical protein